MCCKCYEKVLLKRLYWVAIQLWQGCLVIEACKNIPWRVKMTFFRYRICVSLRNCFTIKYVKLAVKYCSNYTCYYLFVIYVLCGAVLTSVAHVIVPILRSACLCRWELAPLFSLLFHQPCKCWFVHKGASLRRRPSLKLPSDGQMRMARDKLRMTSTQWRSTARLSESFATHR